MNTIPVVQSIRGAVCETVHAVSAVVCSQTGTVRQMFPECSKRRVYLRSAAKPFQAYPLYQNPLAKDITLEEWAIICASHAASQSQLGLVNRVLSRANAHVSDLQCGPHPPLDEAMAKTLLCSDTAPTAIHNNCSGKHAGMLLACRLSGWPIDTYLEPDHPLQQAILNTLITYSGTSDLSIGIDGCGAPVFALPMANIARLFSQFVTHATFAGLVEAMTTYPEVVGDAQRVDTQLMVVSGGNLVAKVGAEGFIGLANRATGEGMAIKAWDGNNAIRDRVTIALLKKLGWLTAEQADHLWTQPQFSKDRLNTQNKVVGHFEITLPRCSTHTKTPIESLPKPC